MAEKTPRDDDTEAILRRRRFLIQSALVGAGMGALLAGCEPEVCLTPQVCLKVAPPPSTKEGAKPATQAEPQVCLELPAPKTNKGAQVCLKLAPPERKPEPKPCLSEARPPRPGPCLSPRRR